MATSTNPFLDDSDCIVNEIVEESNGSTTTVTKIVSPSDSLPQSTEITLDQIAGKLLRDNFILTALELHTELVEAGRELPRLRDYFSNPANFERTKLTELSPTSLVRTSSVQTFDSLDFARYSDDGDRVESDKVAVLEFELRKAQDSIKSLRAALTKSAEPELPSPETPDIDPEQVAKDEPIRPYEIRALNFLVNEYLLNNTCKLTSVTFAEENENQDFEDWDDVGLNMAKPPGLLFLYRDYGQHPQYGTESADFSCNVNIVDKDVERQLENNIALNKRVADLDDQIISLSNDNDFLAHRIKAMEREAETVRALRQKSSTPSVSPITTPLKTPRIHNNRDTPQIIEECHSHESVETGIERLADTDLDHDENAIEMTTQSDDMHQHSIINELDEDVPATAESKTSCTEPEHRTEQDRLAVNFDHDRLAVNSIDQDRLAVNSIDQDIDQDRDAVAEQNRLTLNSCLGTSDIPHANLEECSSLAVEVGSILPSQSVTLDDSSVIMNTTGQRCFKHSVQRNIPQNSIIRRSSNSFQEALMKTAFHVSHDNRIVSEVSRLTESGNKVVLILGRCLPHIVPNVILAKREELIPIILCTATLHPDSRQRDQLLNILFNLIKRPDSDQRQMILTGCVAFAQHVGPERVEIELLPQCWEQISHKYVERRLLVAEACGTLAPYIPNELRGSLVLSMLKQMLQDDKADEVREAVVRSLGLLMLFVDDPDKYSEGVQLLYGALQDLSSRVQVGVKQVFLPAFAMWALELGRLESHLLQSLMDKVEDLVTGGMLLQKTSTTGVLPPDRQQFCMLLHTLQLLIPFLFGSVIMTGPFVNKTPPSEEQLKSFSVSSRFPERSSDLYDLCMIFDGSERLAALVHLYEEYIAEEWYEPWEAYTWVAGELVPQLLSLLTKMDVSCMSIVQQLSTLFLHICKTFGRKFTLTKIKNKFQVVLNIPEEHTDTMLSAGQTPLTKCAVPVYAAGVLAALGQDENRKELAHFLQDLLRTLSLCHAPLDSLKAAFTQLCLNCDYHELLLGVLWDGVVHTSAYVRSSSAQLFELLIKGIDEILLSSRVIPALVTLANDPDITVRISTVPAFGTIMECVTDRNTEDYLVILDKVHMQFQSFIEDPMYRDQHTLHLELVLTFGRVGPNAEPRFRDQFVLPHLAIMAATNSHVTNDTAKRQMALQLFDAYSALSCCFINDQLLQEAMLPGLRYLHNDLQQVAPEMVDVVASMIHELEDKLDSSKLTDGSMSGSNAAVLTPGEKMLSRFKDVTQSKPNFSKIFGKK